MCHVTGEVSKSSHLVNRVKVYENTNRRECSLVEIFIMKMPCWSSLVNPIRIMFQPLPVFAIEAREAPQREDLHFLTRRVKLVKSNTDKQVSS